MAITREHPQTRIYSHSNGQEHYAFDDLEEIGRSFVPVSGQELNHDTATPSLRICFVDTSVDRAIRVADYLRSHGHSIVEHQSIDDIFDALVSENYDVLLMGSVGSARVPLIRSVKELVASYDKAIRVAVISTNEAINRELLAAGADDTVDADTDTPFFNAVLTAAFEYIEPDAPQVAQRVAETATAPHSVDGPTQATAEPELVAEQVRAEVRAPDHNAAANDSILEELHEQVQKQNAHSESLHFPAPAQEAPVSFSNSEEKAAKPEVLTTLPNLENQPANPTSAAKEEQPQTPRAEKSKSKRDEKKEPPPAPRPDPVFVAVEKARKGDIDIPAPTSQLQELVWMLGVIPVKLPVLLALAWIVVKFVVPNSPGV